VSILRPELDLSPAGGSGLVFETWVGIEALKLSVAHRSRHRPFWQARYCNFNAFTEGKRVEKLEYMHWNPVRRRLVETMEQWLMVQLPILLRWGSGAGSG
jgi:hypothetical protein